MIQKANILACAASVPMNGVLPIFADASNPTQASLANAFQNGCTLARVATGAFELIVDEQQQTPLNLAVPIVTVIQNLGGPVSNIGSFAILASEAAGPSGIQTAWVIVTFDGSSPTSPPTPVDFPGQLAVAILAVGDPGGSGI